MRGKANHAICPEGQCGITPAYAGKSTRYSSHNQRDWDHPRVCGEKALAQGFNVGRQGSPPRMRGKVINTDVPGHGLGITPAYAGKRVLFTTV